MTQFNKNLNMSMDITQLDPAEEVFILIICILEIPIVLVTLFAMCFFIKSHHAASVYVIHLIFSDLLQIVILLIITTDLVNVRLWSGYKYCLSAGLFFMACIAVERYLLVSHPHWYKSHQSVKMSCFVSVITWLVPLIFADVKQLALFTLFSQCLACFIPYAIIILCFIGTWRGLSHAISLTSHKRKLILGSLSLVLLNYTFLILPLSITSFCLVFVDHYPPFALKLYIFCHCLAYLNPIADCFLYLFMRSDAESIIKSLYCCSSPESRTASFNTTNMHSMTAPCSEH